MKTTKKYTLYTIILFCVSLILCHWGKSPNVEDWLSFMVGEVCAQILITEKQ